MNQFAKGFIIIVILVCLHLCTTILQLYKWNVLEPFSMDLIYKKAEDRGFIYLDNPQLLKNIHGSSYSTDEFEQSSASTSASNSYDADDFHVSHYAIR